MSCTRTEDEITAYLDGELEPANVRAFEGHLADCARCSRAVAAGRALRESIGNAGLRFAATPQERRRWLLATRPAAAPRFPARRLQLAAALLLFALGWGLGRYGSPKAGADLTDEVVADHVRALLAGHAADVVSTDQHTVRPWFTGRLDFAPRVADLAERGFPLVGGRLDYAGHRPVAALVYRADRHVISLFTWPAGAGGGGGSARRPDLAARRGFAVAHWVEAGMTYWAVSDAAAERLSRFAAELAAATP